MHKAEPSTHEVWAAQKAGPSVKLRFAEARLCGTMSCRGRMGARSLEDLHPDRRHKDLGVTSSNMRLIAQTLILSLGVIL